MNLKNTKIKVTPEQSIKIQQIVFDLGGSWNFGCTYINDYNFKFLYIDSKLIITWSSTYESGFIEHINKELQANDIINHYQNKNSPTGSFSWAVEQMDKEKILILNNIQYKISDYTFWSRNNNSSQWSSINVNLNMIYATDWEIYEENEFKDMSIEELLHQAHMLGQKDAGCMEPSYSNARTGCLKLTKELYGRDLK